MRPEEFKFSRKKINLMHPTVHKMYTICILNNEVHDKVKGNRISDVFYKDIHSLVHMIYQEFCSILFDDLLIINKAECMLGCESIATLNVCCVKYRVGRLWNQCWVKKVIFFSFLILAPTLSLSLKTVCFYSK